MQKLRRKLERLHHTAEKLGPQHPAERPGSRDLINAAQQQAENFLQATEPTAQQAQELRLSLFAAHRSAHSTYQALRDYRYGLTSKEATQKLAHAVSFYAHAQALLTAYETLNKEEMIRRELNKAWAA